MNNISKIKYSITSLLIKLVPQFIQKEINKQFNTSDIFAHKYYAQEGEDILLLRYFNYKKNGFFVDIGAHHPTKLSNTYKLYDLGWNGINIDAMPGSMQKFNELRNRDINIEAAVSDKIETLTYFKFNEPALNTLDEVKARNIIENSPFKLTDKISLKCKTLKQILEENLPVNTPIDFFSIDVEGFDLRALKSNDWQKFKPKVIIVECDDINLDFILTNAITIYLNNIGYKPFAKTFKSVFYHLS